MPNEVDYRNKVIPDCRGPSLQKSGVSTKKHVPQSKRSEIGAPLHHCFKTEDDGTENHYDMIAAYIPFCPFQEAFNGHLFSSSEHHIKSFKENSIVSIISDCGETGTHYKKRSTAMKVLKDFVGNSKMLSKVFNAKCKEVLSSQKSSQRLLF